MDCLIMKVKILLKKISRLINQVKKIQNILLFTLKIKAIIIRENGESKLIKELEEIEKVFYYFLF